MRARARNAHAIAQVWASQARLRCCQGWTAWPFWHARCSAVLPNELTRVASAPRLSRYAATCTWPLCAEYLPQYGGPGPSALIATAWGRCATAAVSGTWWAAVTSCQRCRRLRRRPWPRAETGLCGSRLSRIGRRLSTDMWDWTRSDSIGFGQRRFDCFGARTAAASTPSPSAPPCPRRPRPAAAPPPHAPPAQRHYSTIEPQSRSGPTDWLTD